MHAIRLEPASGAAPFPSAVWKHRKEVQGDRNQRSRMIEELSSPAKELLAARSEPTLVSPNTLDSARSQRPWRRSESVRWPVERPEVARARTESEAKKQTQTKNSPKLRGTDQCGLSIDRLCAGWRSLLKCKDSHRRGKKYRGIAIRGQGACNPARAGQWCGTLSFGGLETPRENSLQPCQSHLLAAPAILQV
jgi:hypothetical protein